MKKKHNFDSCMVATMICKVQYKQLVLWIHLNVKTGTSGGIKGEVYQGKLVAFDCYSCLSLIDWLIV